MRKLISTGSPFEKTAGYSRAVVQGDWCFVSGTTGYDYATMTMPETVEAQTRNCLATIGKALADGGFDMADVVRAHYYITVQLGDVVFPILELRRHQAGGDDDRLPAQQAGNEDRDRSDGAAADGMRRPKP